MITNVYLERITYYVRSHLRENPQSNYYSRRNAAASYIIRSLYATNQSYAIIDHDSNDFFVVHRYGT